MTFPQLFAAYALCSFFTGAAGKMIGLAIAFLFGNFYSFQQRLNFEHWDLWISIGWAAYLAIKAVAVLPLWAAVAVFAVSLAFYAVGILAIVGAKDKLNT
jgi:hypothetical protein